MVPERFAAVLAELAPLAERFDAAGHRLYLVGGAVRDLLVGADTAGSDLDLTTDARPPEIRRAIAGWADAVWAQGEAFGTMLCRATCLTVVSRDIPDSQGSWRRVLPRGRPDGW